MPLVRSTPYLNRWLEIHPLEEHTAPLWISTHNRFWGKRINTAGLYKMLKKSFKKAGLAHMDYTPQSFRRSRGTINARFMTEVVLEQFMGWSRGTKQTVHYVKMSARDVEAALDAHYGTPAQKKAAQEAKKPKHCHICNTDNAFENRFCSGCGKPLDIEASMKAERDFNEQMRETMKFLHEVMRSPEEHERYKMFKSVMGQ